MSSRFYVKIKVYQGIIVHVVLFGVSTSAFIGGGLAIKLDTPIYSALKAYADSNPAVFHMPGHKLGKGIPGEFADRLARIDITEIPGMDNLHFPSGIIKEAQRLAAEAYGADETFFLVNGSTCGIHAMIMACCRPGDKLIVGRDCHKSVIGGMVLAGVNPVYLRPQFDGTFGITTIIRPDELGHELDQHPDAVGVLLTRPNYYGVCSDIEGIAHEVHSRGKVLMVDEAHGAHLGFNPRLPISAMEGGADICVQSAHKTLPVFTQGAYLHVKSGRIDTERLRHALRMLQTTSPSYVIMAMLDFARWMMQSSGRELLDRLLDNVEQLKRDVENRLGPIFLQNDCAGEWKQDATRLVVCVNKIGMTGFEAGEILSSKHNIQVEMSDLYNIVCITTVADSAEDLARLRQGLVALCEDYKKTSSLNVRVPAYGFSILKQKMRPVDAVNASGAKIRLDMAVDKVSRCIVTPYPPGVPLICPGEAIQTEVVEYIRQIVDRGGIVHGINANFEVDVVDNMI